MKPDSGADRRRSWLDNPRNVTRLVRVLTALCVAFVLADLLYDKHGHFAWENWIGFHAFFGFVAFCIAVLSGWPLRKLLGRREDYYDR